MKILHVADLHLGRQFHGLSLDTDHAAILDQILDALTTQHPDVLIIAGDIYDRAAPPASSVRQFNDFMRRVAIQSDAAVVMIAGNHDSGDRIDAMSVMTDETRALIRGPLMADERPLILTDAAGQVAFSALPFGYEFAARECFGDDTITTPEDVMRAQIASARTHVPSAARWVIVAHGFVAGGHDSDSERPLARVGGIETVPADAFDGAHYVALGHLHKPQSVGAQHIRYSGAPLAFGFDESDEVKSMTLVDLAADGSVQITPLPFAPVRGVRTLRGTLDDLLIGTASDDFIKVVLTDVTPRIDPMKRLRVLFPNACLLSYERDEQTVDRAAAGRIARTILDDPLQVIDDFLHVVRDTPPNEAEIALVTEALNAKRSSEALA